jgi:ERF superfamily
MTNASLTPNEAITTLPAAPSPGGGLVGAIAAVMNEVHTVAKRGVNEFHRYRYAKMEDILREITPLLGRHGIVIFQSETGRAMFDEDNVIAVEYAFTVAHVSGETWPQPLRQTGVSTCRNTKGGWDDKALNKCHTAARKYFLLALFQIPTGEEDDADQGENGRAAKNVVAPPASRQNRISERAIAARVEQAWQGQRTEPFLASEAGMPSTNQDGMPSTPDPDIEARRAAVQLQRSFSKPAYIREPPQRALKRELAKHRNIGVGWEAKIKAETAYRQPRPFSQPNLGHTQVYNERFPPPDDTIPEGPGAPKLDHTDKGGVPAFLDRRKPNGSADDAPASYLDLVGGDR